jgi:methyl-accepting chemotaxis protein
MEEQQDDGETLAAAPASELMQSFQRMVSLIMAAAAEQAQTAATAGAQLTPEFVSGPLAEVADRMAGMTEALTGPLFKLLAEQKRLADLMAEWSEQHRKMSEQIAGWAEEYRRMTEQMQRLVKPLLEQTTTVTETSRVFADELRR